MRRLITSTDIVGIGRHFMSIEEHVPESCPCRYAVGAGTRYTRTYPGAGG